jgi:integrase
MPKSSENATRGSKLVANNATPEKIKFTQRNLIEKTPIPTDKPRAYYYDSERRGLCVAVTPAGKRSWTLYRKVSGRPERILIGSVEDFTPDEARDEADKLNGLIARGANPAHEKRSVKAELSLLELYNKFMDEHAKVRLREKTWKNYESIFNSHLHGWQFRKLFEIRPADVVSLHARIGSADGEHIANRTVELLSSLFSRAIKQFGYQGQNPTKTVEPFPEEKRVRFLGMADETEAARFQKALRQESQLWQDFFQLSIYIGCRHSDLARMKWEQINWRGRVVTLPRETTKGRTTVNVALTDDAIEILEQRKDNGSEFIFPSPRKSESGHIEESKSAWARVLKNAKIRNFRQHDLRHSLGALMAAAGASEAQIGRQLGHKPGSPATRVYMDFPLDSLRPFLGKSMAALKAASDEKLLEAKNARS